MTEALAGRYHLGAPLGSGGSATVFRARDAVLDRQVAVKLLHPHLARDEAVVAEFLAQARATALLDHPHVVAVTDAGSDDGLVWSVQELVDGLTLAELVAVEGPLSQADAMTVLCGVLAGLAHAHVRGVLHLDLSASNVMVPWADGRPDLTRALVLDLGTRRERTDAGAGRSTAATVRVSPAYASPEVATGSPVGPAADLYSTGALLHVLLTGRPPFEAPTAVALLEAHVHEPVPVPPGLDPCVRDVLVRCLAKRPTERFASATAAGIAVARARGTLLARGAGGGRTRDLPTVPGRPLVPPRPVVPARPHRVPEVADARPPAPAPAGQTGGAGTASPRSWFSVAVVVLTLVFGLGAAGLGWADVGGRGGDVSPVATTQQAATPTPTPTLTATAVVSPPPGPVEATTVPPVAGLLADEARAALEQVGLVVGPVTQLDGPRLPGTVVASEPVEGSAALPGDVVTLTVASGATAVPDVRGLTGAQARVAADAAGLALEGPVADEARVAWQDPEPGRRAPVGSALAVASEPPSPTPTPRATPTPTPTPDSVASPTPTSGPDPTPSQGRDPTPDPGAAPAVHAPIG